MRIGTTPTITIGLPFDTAEISALELTFAQRGQNVLYKHEDDVTLDGKAVRCTLTQEETFQFTSGTMDVQLRFWRIGKLYGTEVYHMPAYGSLSKKVLLDV